MHLAGALATRPGRHDGYLILRTPNVNAQTALTGEPTDHENGTPADAANRARPSAVLRTVITSDQAYKAPQQDLLGRGLHNVRLVPPVGVEPTLRPF